MKLNAAALRSEEWAQKGYRLPRFDRQAVAAETKALPFWIHFGPGNIFRAFPAVVMQKLLDEGKLSRGIIAAEGYDTEIIDMANRPFDDCHIAVTLKADGSVEKTLVASVVESLKLDRKDQDMARLEEIFENPALQMASFTITEKGYNLCGRNGEFFPDVAADFTAPPCKSVSYMGKVAALLYKRFQAGALPVAMVSMDNCSHNGDKLAAAITAFANHWIKNGLAEPSFAEYLQQKVSFPWTMIDKITPRPDASVQAMLEADGVENVAPVVTSKNTYVAPFVNAEETEYLVIEDDFPNGRPDALSEGGFIFTHRETVDKVEKMKVCTCLNPLHTALAVYGCLLGYDKIWQEMKDPELFRLVQTIGYTEGLPVVVDPEVLDPKEFIDTVVGTRLPNPFMPDAPARIATDTSQKLAVRFGETVKAYVASPHLNVEDLKIIPLVYAGWLRYLMGIKDDGQPFDISPDPLLDKVRPFVTPLALGDSVSSPEALYPLLKDKGIFGVDLVEVGLADRVISLFNELLAGIGAVRATLNKYL